MATNPLFDDLNALPVHSSEIDEIVKNKELGTIGLFIWGRECPNCEIAKRVMADRKNELFAFNIKWFQSNTYEDFDMATKFGINGIPTFIFFKNGKKIGRISPFPGWEAFSEAISKI